MVPKAAKNAVARRQELVAKADEAQLRGQRLMADRDYEGAVSEFRKALDLLPDAPVVQDRRREYTAYFADASVALARQRAEEGRYTEAIQLVTAVLEPGVDPENPEARRLLQDLNDPEIYSPALTPEHISKVKQVDTALKVAESHIRLGNYDSAERSYHEVLNYDPYNSAARRGLERVENYRRQYYDTAYDQTRATFMRQIAEQWELAPPRYGVGEQDYSAGGLPSERDEIEYINTKLKRIIIPEIEFENTPLADAIEFLRIKSRELDDLEPDPTRKGVNIIIRSGSSGGGGGGAFGGGGGGDLGFDSDAGAAAGGFGGGDDPANTPISLKLSNVPLMEALRYTTELARLKYKVEPHAVVVIPITELSDDLYTQIFRVPPSFRTQGGGGGGGGASDDPFAGLDDSGPSSSLQAKKSAREILEEAGVNFPPGSSAIYNESNSQLIVRNTQTQLDLIDAYVESLVSEVEKQIYITTKFVEIRQDDDDTFGFDWLLGQANLPGNNRVFTSGGTVGSTRNQLNPLDYPFIAPGQSLPVGQYPVTSGFRSGTTAVNSNSIDSLLSENLAGQSTLAPAIFSLAGVFTDPQFQVVLRAISQHAGSDLMSAPSVVARSGQRAKIEVIREFIYPSEYDPPEIPQEFGAINDTSGVGLGGSSSVNSFPVTPANPAAFETRNVGVTLEVDPQIGPDGYTIDLNLSPEVVEFEGFINYGSPIFSGGVANGVPVRIELTENRIEMPVFATRRVSTAVTIWDGQTVSVGGLIREDIQTVQDKLPILGDLPLAGFFFRTESDVRTKRNLNVFVTAQLIDPAGLPVIETDLGGLPGAE